MPFVTETTSEEHARHRRVAQLCAYAYKRPEDVIVEHDHPDDGYTYVVFEGSDTIVNWIDNLDVRKMDGVHRGFARHARHCIRQYDLVHVLTNHPNVVIGGHSMGAAAALLVVHELAPFMKNVKEVVLLGCPRVGDNAFLEQFRTHQSKIFVYKNGRDPVCSIPFGFMGFSNGLEQCSIVLNPAPEVSRGFLRGIRAHLISEYVSSMSSLFT